MAEFVDVALSFPALLWTLALGFSLVFWVTSTVLGGASELGVEVDAGDAASGLTDALGLAQAPISVVLTILSAVGWLVTMLAAIALDSPPALLGIVVLAISLVVAVPVTKRIARLVHPLYAANRGIDHDHLIGRTCTVRTGRVDDGFGQAEVIDGEGAAHLISVRCAAPNELGAGSKALVVAVEDGVFVIDPELPWTDDL